MQTIQATEAKWEEVTGLAAIKRPHHAKALRTCKSITIDDVTYLAPASARGSTPTMMMVRSGSGLPIMPVEDAKEIYSIEDARKLGASLTNESGEVSRQKAAADYQRWTQKSARAVEPKPAATPRLAAELTIAKRQDEQEARDRKEFGDAFVDNRLADPHYRLMQHQELANAERLLAPLPPVAKTEAEKYEKQRKAQSGGEDLARAIFGGDE